VENRHAVIAGSGRSGTTFLIEFLAECGVPTHPLEELGYFPEARAGREQSLLDTNAGYLIKDPWFFDYVDQIDLQEVRLDAVIIPVRDIRAAAISRVIQERSSRYANDRLNPLRTMFGDTPAGVLNPIDVAEQEKHLAVSQSRLFSWCLGNDLPVFMLQYPRLVNDGEYLVSILWPWLQNFTTEDKALRAFKQLAMPNLTIDELSNVNTHDPETMNLKIEVEALTRALETLRQRSEQTVIGYQRDISERDHHIESAQFEINKRVMTENELTSRVHELHALGQRLREENRKLRGRVTHLRRQNQELRNSRSYRLGQAILKPVHALQKWVR
jgi:hypothetical protein